MSDRSPSEPFDPASSIPSAPSGPSEPPAPAEPSASGQPAEPSASERPTEPVASERPTGPSGAEGSSAPASADRPAEDTAAPEPARPADADQPVTPGQPAMPGGAAAPGGATAPDQPFGHPSPGQPVPGQHMPGAPGWPGQPTPGAWDPAVGPSPGGVFPPTAGFPPGADPAAGFPAGYPPYGGYQPYQLPYGWQAGGDPNDPLVNPPHAGVEGWFRRCTGALRRGWRVLLPLMLLTQAVPAAVVSLLSLGLGPTEQDVPADGSLPDGFLGDLITFGVAVLVASLLLGLAQSVGWAAGSWVVARQAAGEPADLGGALRYGVRRAPGLWGWTLLITLIMTVGFCFCVLPGIYLAFALALTGPVYLFERQNPIGRSFRFFHDRLGMVLGRVALVAAAVIVGSMVGGLLESFGTLPFGTDPFSSPGTAVGASLVVVLSAVLVVPVYVAQLVGLVVTYAEQRAHEGPVNAAQLAAELG